MRVPHPARMVRARDWRRSGYTTGGGLTAWRWRMKRSLGRRIV